jgi:hypothetical protein
MSFGTVQLSLALVDFAKAYPAIELDVSLSESHRIAIQIHPFALPLGRIVFFCFNCDNSLANDSAFLDVAPHMNGRRDHM